MTVDEKWEGRWKRLKEYIQKDINRCTANINTYKSDIMVAHGWFMARETDRVILDEMARLEKEE